MRNRRMASRLLALALTALMLVSCFVALPAMAEGETTSGKKVLWGYDFARFGTQNNTSLKDNYFSKNDVFVMDVSGTGATGLSGGMLTIGGATYIRNTKTAGSNSNSDFYDLLFGHYEGYNKVGSKIFMEMDFQQVKLPSAKEDTECSWGYYNENDERIEGSGTLYTDDCGGSGALVFQFKNGAQNRPLFRVTAGGKMYTRDNEDNYTYALANGSVYYKDADGNKVYLPSGASVSNLNLGYCLKDPSKAYQLEVGVTYRIGVAIRISGIDSAGKVTLVADVYVKKAGASNWETKVGSTTYYYYPIGANTNATAANEYIQLNDSSYVVNLGGVWEIYANTCNGTDHLNVLASSADPLDDTLRACTCIDCGESWTEREVDGLRYKGVTSGTVCEGMYKVWYPLDGVGAPFADSEYLVLGEGHAYNNSGVCTECGKQEYAGYLSKGFRVSGKPGSIYNVSGYTTEGGRGYITSAYSREVYLFGDTSKDGGAYMLGNKEKAFTISFDLNANDIEWNPNYKNYPTAIGNFVELVTLVTSANKSVNSQLLSIGIKPDGTPFISFAYDFAGDSAKTKHSVTVSLVEGENGTKVVNTNDAKYAELMTWFKACAAPGQDVNTAVGGVILVDGVATGCNYFTITETDTSKTFNFLYPQVSQYDITEGEWFNVAVTVIPDSKNNAQLLLYINGELVAMRPQALVFQADWQSVRIGAVNGRFTRSKNNYDNISIRVHETIADAYKDVSNDRISFAFDRFQSTVLDPDYGGTYFGNAFSHSATRVGAFSNTLDPSLDIYNGGEYAYFSDDEIATSDALQFSMTTKIGGTTADTGVKHQVVSDYKYEAKAVIAVDRNSPINADVVRLSKYTDSFAKVVLLKLTPTGFVANGKELYTINGERLSPYTTVTDGVPEAFTDVRVVVDEIANCYSVYVNEKVAYYKNGDAYVPYYNVQMPSPESSNVGYANADKAEYASFNVDKTKYHTYTDAYFQELIKNGAVKNYAYACEYIRFFQGWNNFYLQSVTVSAIPDSEVEWIGVQERLDTANNLFDVRFVAAVDDIYVPGIGFSVEAFVNGSSRGTKDIILDHVYDSLQAGDGFVSAYEFTEGEYLTAFSVVGIDLTNNANDVYTFRVTPYTADEDGTRLSVGETRTFKYNGKGVCVDNGRPKEFNPEDFKEFMSSPVILELKQKAVSAAGDYADFFVYTQCSDPSGRYYVRYKMLYSYDTRTTNGTNSATNIESFRVVGAELVKLNSVSETGISYTPLTDLLSAGEISLAIKEYVYSDEANGNGVNDFCGGFHGDEHIVKVEGKKQFSLKADGESYTPGTETKIVQCETVTFDQVSRLDRWATEAGSEGQFVEHTQKFTFTDDGMKIDRKVEWLVGDFVIDSAYPMMFTLLRLSNNAAVCEIVEAFDANGVSTGKMIYELHNTDEQKTTLSNAKNRMFKFSSATSGISAVAGFTLGENHQGILGSPYIAYRKDNSGSDNKLYVPMKGSTSVSVRENTAGEMTTKTQPVLGEVWEISTYYDIDYVKPNN